MKRKLLAASAMALAAIIATPAAQSKEATELRIEHHLKAADSNSDGRLTRNEFLQAMAKAYDEASASKRNDPQRETRATSALERDQALFGDLYRGSH